LDQILAAVWFRGEAVVSNINSGIRRIKAISIEPLEPAGILWQGTDY
jgi:hypothetical protein